MQKRVDIEDCDLEDDLVMLNGLPFTGVLYSLFEDGSIQDEKEFQNGLPHGLCQEFFPSGKLRRKWHANNGRAVGKLIELYENGAPKLEENREFGVVLSSKSWDQKGDLVESRELDVNSDAYDYVMKCRQNYNQST